MAEHLERAEPDLLRSMLKTFVEALMSTEADAVCGADYGTRTAERVNSCNGYRPREWDTCTRAERAMVSVVATCYLLGVSTRWRWGMEKLVEQLGITRLSKSQSR